MYQMYQIYQMHAMNVYWQSVTLFSDHDDVILFSGVGDRIGFARGANDTVTTIGLNQTVATGFTGPMTVIDHGHGLNIELSQSVATMTIKDFQTDQNGSLTVIGQGPVVLTPDGQGGTNVVTTGAVLSSRVVADFVGDDHLSMTQIHTV